MESKDKYCRIIAVSKVHSGKLEAYKDLCKKFVEKTGKEPKCLYHEFSFDGDHACCLEGYEDADALLLHIENVASLLEEAWKISKLTHLEIHGPEEELAKLRNPLAVYKPQYFARAYGYCR